MKKIGFFLKAVTFLLYRYYSDGPKASISFFTAKAILALILWSHVTVIGLIFFHNATHKITSYIVRLTPIGSRLMSFVELALMFILISLIIRDEKEIKSFECNENLLKKIKIRSIVYLIGFIILAGFIIKMEWYIS